MRPIDAKPVEKIFKRWLDDIPDGEETPAIEQCLNVVKNAPTLTPPNETLTLNQLREMDDDPEGIDLEEIAIAYLNICGEHCNGDPAKGIPSCPFYEFPDVGMFGEPLPFGCRLEGYRNCRRRTEDD